MEKSEFFHDSCKKVRHKSWGRGKTSQYPIQDIFCVTHEIVICRCGWEWGKHFARDHVDKFT